MPRSQSDNVLPVALLTARKILLIAFLADTLLPLERSSGRQPELPHDQTREEKGARERGDADDDEYHIWEQDGGEGERDDDEGELLW